MSTIEELQREIQVLRDEVRQLRERPEPVPATTSSWSRRSLLRVAPLAAVGGAVAALSPAPASAAAGQPVLLGRHNDASGATTQITGAVSVSAPSGATFAAAIAGAVQLTPEGPIGSDGLRVAATGPGTGLTVEVIDGSFTLPDNTRRPQIGTGLEVAVENGSALVASTSAAASSIDAVRINYAGTSRALYAQSHNPANINGTVTGVNEGHGIGVWGEQRNSTGAGFGVVGVGGAQGRGARLSGGAAAAQMLPSTATTHPTTGKAGDFFVDASVRLWFCQKASSGSTGATWKQIA